MSEPIKRKRRQKTVDLFEDQHEEIDRLAGITGLTPTFIIQQALDKQLKLGLYSKKKKNK